MPAPRIVTLFTMMCPGTRKVPAGIQTVPPAPAELIAELNADVESAEPVGSAPKLVMETEPDGWASAAPTFSKSAKSMVYEEAVSPASTCNRNLVPAG